MIDIDKELELDKLAEKYGLIGHQINYLKFFLGLYEVKGRDVLEVGGALPAEIVIDFLGCNSWTAIESPGYNITLGVQNQQSHIIQTSCSSYTAIEKNIEDINDDFNENFDIIFSIACFEHIAKLPQAMDKMHQTLRPGGELFSLFAPIWSSYGGHHCMGTIPERFDVTDRNLTAHIYPFQHLLQSRREVHTDFSRRFDRSFSDEVIYNIFNNPHINRYFSEDYFETIRLSPFVITQVAQVFSHNLEPATQLALETHWPGYRSFNHLGLLVRLGKLTN